MEKSYKSNEERIFAGFRRFSKILKREEFGHHGKSRILNILVENGPMTQKRLQEEVEITSASASELLKKMEEHKLVKRTPDPASPKGLIVEITDEGRSICASLNEEKAGKSEKLFRALSEEEKKAFADMLDKIQKDWYEQGLFYGDCKRHREKQLGKCR